MPMIDTFKYEEKYYAHFADDDYMSGDEYDTLEDALESAKNDALTNGSNTEVTHVFVRTIKRVVVETHIEDL